MSAVTDDAHVGTVVAYLLRGVILAMVVVALWCRFDTQREGWVLLWVAAAAMAGSAGVDHLVRLVCRLAGDRS